MTSSAAPEYTWATDAEWDTMYGLVCPADMNGERFRTVVLRGGADVFKSTTVRALALHVRDLLMAKARVAESHTVVCVGTKVKMAQSIGAALQRRPSAATSEAPPLGSSAWLTSVLRDRVATLTTDQLAQTKVKNLRAEIEQQHNLPDGCLKDSDFLPVLLRLVEEARAKERASRHDSHPSRLHLMEPAPNTATAPNGKPFSFGNPTPSFAGDRGGVPDYPTKASQPAIVDPPRVPVLPRPALVPQPAASIAPLPAIPPTPPGVLASAVNPFFPVIQVLERVSLRVGSRTFMVTVPVDMHSDILSRRNRVMVIPVESYASSHPAAWPKPNELYAAVNSTPVTQSWKRLWPNRKHALHKGYLALDVTPLINRSAKQKFQFDCFAKDYHAALLVVVAQAVEPHTAVRQLENVIQQEARFVKPYGFHGMSSCSQEEDVVAGYETVTTKCPLSLTRMTMPAKSRQCKHLQCFELGILMKTCATSCFWNCPRCDTKMSKDDIVVDPYMAEALKLVSPTAKTLRLVGTEWRVLEHEDDDNKASAAKAQRRPTADLQCVEVDSQCSPSKGNGSDDEEEIARKRNKYDGSSLSDALVIE